MASLGVMEKQIEDKPFTITHLEESVPGFNDFPKLDLKNKPLFIGISGGSASGKSFLCD